MTSPLTPRVLHCVECKGTDIKKVGGERIYPRRGDLHWLKFYLCECGAYCGSHKDTGVALGFPAGPRTRRARQAAHAVLDPIWRKGLVKRNELYKRLAKEMGLTPETCHIAMMDLSTALAVPDALDRIRIEGIGT